MMTPTRESDDRILRMLALRQFGFPDDWIAEHLGISITGLRGQISRIRRADEDHEGRSLATFYTRACK